MTVLCQLWSWETTWIAVGAIAAVVAAISASFFACQLNEINLRQLNRPVIDQYTQHYLKLMEFYSEFNFMKIIHEFPSTDCRFFNDLYFKLEQELPNLRIINSEVKLFSSTSIQNINNELFNKYVNLLTAIQFNKPVSDIYHLLIKVWEADIAYRTTEIYQQAIKALR